MKKFCVGLVLGIILTLTSGVLANSSLVGKTIQGTFPLIVDGNRAEKDVIVVEGTSYLPVRAAADLFEYDVGFENETVILTKQPVNQTEPAQQEEGMQRQSIEPLPEEGEVMTKEELELNIGRLETKIGTIKFNINYNNGMTEKLEEKGNLTDEEKQQLENHKTEAQKLQEQLRQLERQKAELEAQLEQLEASE